MDGNEQKEKILEQALNVVRDEGIAGLSYEKQSLFLTAYMCRTLERIEGKFNNKPPWYKNRASFSAISLAIGAAVAEFVNRMR